MRTNVGVNVTLSRRHSMPRVSLLGFIAGIIIITMMLTWYGCILLVRGVTWLITEIRNNT